MQTGEGYRAAAVSAFEAAALVRGTGVCPGRSSALLRNGAIHNGTTRNRVGAGAPTGGLRRAGTITEGDDDLVVEFGRAQAAGRLVDLLRAAGIEPGADEYTAGNRHRYRIHRVVAPPEAADLLAHAWRFGYRELCSAVPGRHSTPRQRQHLLRLSNAAWRAAWLVNGPRRVGSPGLRVGDLEVATALIRAARYLDVAVRMTTRPGGQLILVVPAGADTLVAA